MTSSGTKLNFTSNRHLRVGDRVVMQMDKEARSWGRKGPEDGTEGTIIGKYRATVHRLRYGIDTSFWKPGVYEQDGVAIVHWDGHEPDLTVIDGLSYTSPSDASAFAAKLRINPVALKAAMEFSRTSDTDMALVDREEADRRYQEEWVSPVLTEKTVTRHQQEDKLLNVQRVGDLPETMAWEGDRIEPSKDDLKRRTNSEGEPVHMRVHMIHYEWVPQEPHTYMVSWFLDKTGEDARMGSTYISDKDIKSVERGNVWKHYNGVELNFASLREEIDFAHAMGMTQELSNPLQNNLFVWSKSEALQAIKENRGQGITMGGFLSSADRISLYRFKDEDLAARVRETTLRGFGIAA